jgi:hypothetical protein
MVKLLKLTLICALALAAQDLLPEPTQRTDGPYRLFRTRNMYTFLKLDTRTGQIWHVQWTLGAESNNLTSDSSCRQCTSPRQGQCFRILLRIGNSPYLPATGTSVREI